MVQNLGQMKETRSPPAHYQPESQTIHCTKCIIEVNLSLAMSVCPLTKCSCGGTLIQVGIAGYWGGGLLILPQAIFLPCSCTLLSQSWYLQSYQKIYKVDSKVFYCSSGKYNSIIKLSSPFHHVNL